jgi:NADP-dependent 3-hydroxy acid dehydrogenase YdfG
MTIQDKVVAITGASGGIGRATALLLAKRGARVVLGARRAEEIATVAAEIENAGGQAVWRPTDVTKKADLEALVALAGERFGRLALLRERLPARTAPAPAPGRISLAAA